jgi:hypothetical protein
LEIYLIDGTYELFRHFYALPPAKDAKGREIAAVRGVVASIGGMLKTGVTHIGVATDHVIESFRNPMWPGYKTGAGIAAELLGSTATAESQIDQALTDSFPASDSPPWTLGVASPPPTAIRKPKRQRD